MSIATALECAEDADLELPSTKTTLSAASSVESALSTDSESDSDAEMVTLGSMSKDTPKRIVRKLTHQRRASKISILGAAVRRLFIEKKKVEDGVPSRIVKGLYLGSIGAAVNTEWLESHSITHVLCVANGIKPASPDKFTYKTIDITDSPDSRLIDYFEETSDYIQTCIASQGRCLVHCFAGMSRSVTVVSAYLMKIHRMGAIPSLKLVSRKRTQARPNAGFILQLVKYQTQLGIESKDTEEECQITDDEDSNSDSEDEQTEDDDEYNDDPLLSTTAVISSSSSRIIGSSVGTTELTSPDRLSVRSSPASKSSLSSSRSSSSMHSETASSDSIDSLLSVHGSGGGRGRKQHEPSESMGIFLKTLLAKKAEKVGFDSPVVSQIDTKTKRRPSLLTALERFRAIKTQSQKNVFSGVGPLPDSPRSGGAIDHTPSTDVEAVSPLPPLPDFPDTGQPTVVDASSVSDGAAAAEVTSSSSPPDSSSALT